MGLGIISDVHLGRYKYGKLNPETGLDRRTEDILANVEQAIQIASDRNAHTFMILGDLYHLKRPLPIFREVLAKKIAKALKRDMDVFIILGNHDQGRTSSHDLVEFGELDELIDNFHVIDRPDFFEEGEYFYAFLPHVNQTQLNISNQEFYKYQIEQIERLTGIAKKSKAKYKFFFGHFGTDRSIAGKSFDVGKAGKSPRTIPVKSFDKEVWTRVYLGDIHKQQELNDFCRHVGSVARVDFGEEFEEKGMYWFEDGEEEFIKFEDREFKTLELDLSSDARKKMGQFCEDVQDVDVSEAVVRLKVTIKEEDRDLISWKGLEEYLKEESWKYVGKSITEIRKEGEDAVVDEDRALDYVKMFKDYVKQIDVDDDMAKKVDDEGTKILAEVLNG